MSSRSRKILALACQQTDINNDGALTCQQKQNEYLINQLENDPSFINKLPILLLDQSNEPSQHDQYYSLYSEPQANNNNMNIVEEIEDSTSNFSVLAFNNSVESSCYVTSSPLHYLEPSTSHDHNNEYSDKHVEENKVESTNNTASRNSDIGMNTVNESDSSRSAESPEYSFSDESRNEGFRLVDYSEHSDSDNQSDQNEPVKRKRRKRCLVDKSTWKYERNRKNRESGQHYFGRKKTNNTWNNTVMKPPRTLKSRCKCKEPVKQCKIRCFFITEEDRHNIFSAFWKMSWGEKKIYVDALVKIVPTQRHRDRKTVMVSRRNFSAIYNLRKGEELIRVCKTMFLNTLCIGKWCIFKWKETMPKQMNIKRVNEEELTNTTSSISSGHKKATKTNPFELENKLMHDFLDNLPTMESHYCRKWTEKKYLLPDWSSKRALYDFYVNNWCKERNVKGLSICSFYTAMDIKNMSLYHPKKDQCQICFSHKLGQYPDNEHALHIEKKEEARKEKESDKKTEKYVFTMDMQAVLLAPRSNVSSLYYRTKLCVHNFCLFDLKTLQGTCYLWNESEGGLNAEEFATIVVKFLLDLVIPQLEKEITNENKKIILYSDGCTYQNRNVTMSNALLNLAMTNNIIIEQKFLEVGHTQMEADSMHASIEKKLKNKVINIPAEYIDVCRKARKKPEPYNVYYLTHDYFKIFNDVNFYKTIRPGKMKGDPKVVDLRALQYNPNGNIFFKLRFRDDWIILPQRKDNKVMMKLWNELSNLYATRRKIKKRKFEDLQELKKVIPSDYHDYYNTIPFE